MDAWIEKHNWILLPEMGEKEKSLLLTGKKKILSSNRETESRDAVGTATLLLDLTVSGVSDVEPGEDIKV